MKLNPVGVDLSKSVFQLSICNSHHQIVERKRLSRMQFRRWLATHDAVHLVMEACGTSHHWGRVALSCGHHVSLLHAAYVKPYVRRNKTDAADADALLQAKRDRQLHSIAVKSEELQAVQSLHRIRERWTSARVASLNEARALLAEFGVSLPKLIPESRLRNEICEVPVLLRDTLHSLIDECCLLRDRIKQLDRVLKDYAKHSKDCGWLMQISGIGVTTATAAVARVSNIHSFKCGRSFASWLGITCREYSSGSTRRMGRITKQGDRYLRTLLIHGARSALLAARRKASAGGTLTRVEHWAVNTEQRIGHNKATVALANKMARMMWAVWTRQCNYDGNDALRFAA